MRTVTYEERREPPGGQNNDQDFYGSLEPPLYREQTIVEEKDGDFYSIQRCDQKKARDE
jgi:hypothetical protein